MITYNEWMAGTKAPAKRTAELKAVDAALKDFQENRIEPNFTALLNLMAKWTSSKGLTAEGKIKTARNGQVVTRLVNDLLRINCGVFGPWLEQDIQLARKLCDPFITKRVVGQNLGDSEQDKEKYKKGAGQSAGALFGEIQKLRKDDNANIKPSAALKVNPFGSRDFWLRKGQTESNAVANGGLWCDASAALIAYLLANNANFKSSLHIVSQGDPKHHGHWYIVANRADNEFLEYGYNFGPGDGYYNITIDIWGAIRGKRKSSVVNPASAIYNCQHGTGEAYDHNNIKVHCQFPPKTV